MLIFENIYKFFLGIEERAKEKNFNLLFFSVMSMVGTLLYIVFMGKINILSIVGMSMVLASSVMAAIILKNIILVWGKNEELKMRLDSLIRILRLLFILIYGFMVVQTDARGYINNTHDILRTSVILFYAAAETVIIISFAMCLTYIILKIISVFKK